MLRRNVYSLYLLEIGYLVVFYAHSLAYGLDYDPFLQSSLSDSITAATKVKRFFNLTSNRIDLQPSPSASVISSLCSDHSSLQAHIGCCKPTDLRYIWNAKIENSKIHLYPTHFGNNTQSLPLSECDRLKAKYKVVTGVSWGSLPLSLRPMWKQLGCDAEFKVETHQLPSIKGRFTMGVVNHPPSMNSSSTFPFDKCKSYFDGTLHVIGLSSTSNIFLTFADNLLNLFALLVYDYYFYPNMLHLPRKLLIYPDFYVGNKLCKNPVKHFEILLKTFSGGHLTLNQASGMCFKRIIWGQGPSLLYDDVLIALRRQTTFLLRIFVQKLYRIPVNTKAMKERNRSTRQRRIVIYSRDKTSLKRNLDREDNIVLALSKASHNVTLSKSTGSIPLQQQLELALNTDVIIG